MGVRFLPDRSPFLRGPAAPPGPEALAWQAAVVTNGGTVSAARLQIVQNFIGAEIAAGPWALTDDYFPLWGENAIQALTSLKQRRLATAVGAPTFTADQGYTFSGSAYIDTLFVPSVNAVAMTGTNMRLAFYERTNVAGNTYCGGVIDGSSTKNLSMRPRTPDFQFAANSILTTVTTPIADSRGYSVGSRTAGGVFTGWKNGVSLGTVSPANAAVLPAISFYIGAVNNAGVAANFRATAQGFVALGASLSAGQEAAQYANVQAWAVAIGAQAP